MDEFILASISLSIWWTVFNNIWYWKDLTIKWFYWFVDAATNRNNISSYYIFRVAQLPTNNICCNYSNWNIFCKTQSSKINYEKISNTLAKKKS